MSEVPQGPGRMGKVRDWMSNARKEIETGAGKFAERPGVNAEMPIPSDMSLRNFLREYLPGFVIATSFWK